MQETEKIEMRIMCAEHGLELATLCGQMQYLLAELFDGCCSVVFAEADVLPCCSAAPAPLC